VSRRRALIAVFAVGVLFLAAMLRATGGRLSLPLDDSFIYFQYAQQTAMGHPLVYQPGEAPTTGATSLPWMLVLSAVSLLGFDGRAMIVPAMLLGGLLLAFTVRQAGAAERSLTREPAGLPLASLLVLLCGPLQWGAWSGMEIAYFAAAILWTFREIAEAGGRPTRRGAIAAAFLATARPEGALLALLAVAAWAVHAVADRGARRAFAWAAVPAALAFAQPLVNFLATGEPRSTGFLAKTMLAQPGADPVEVVRTALLTAAGLAAAVFGGITLPADGRGLYAYESEAAFLYVAPGAAALFLAGILPALVREWRERRPGPAAIGLGWIAVLFVGTCTLEEPDAHFSRYQMPIVPVFLVYVAVGVARLARGLAETAGGLARLAAGVRGWLLLWGAASVLFFAGAYGHNSRDIDAMQIRFGESLRETLSAADVVAINDAGAIAYFSGRRTLDLVGLTTPGFAGLWPQGSGALWERLESLPPARRPGWFCYFPNWFELDALGILRRRGSVRLLAPSIVDAEKVLARADWSLAGSGDVPRLEGEGVRVVDRLDVADVRSERAHGFRWWNPERGADAGTFARRAGFSGRPGDEAIDGGRTVLGGVAMELARDPDSPAALVLRTPSGVRQRLLVSVDGGPASGVEVYAPGAGEFHEQVVARIPPGTDRARVEIRVTPEAAGSAPLILAHVFVLAGSAE
jgi:hypothetical protein